MMFPCYVAGSENNLTPACFELLSLLWVYLLKAKSCKTWIPFECDKILGPPDNRIRFCTPESFRGGIAGLLPDGLDESQAGCCLFLPISRISGCVEVAASPGWWCALQPDLLGARDHCSPEICHKQPTSLLQKELSAFYLVFNISGIFSGPLICFTTRN